MIDFEVLGAFYVQSVGEIFAYSAGLVVVLFVLITSFIAYSTLIYESPKNEMRKENKS